MSSQIRKVGRGEEVWRACFQLEVGFREETPASNWLKSSGQRKLGHDESDSRIISEILITASVRFLTPSFRITLRTCAFTRFSLMLSS